MAAGSAASADLADLAGLAGYDLAVLGAGPAGLAAAVTAARAGARVALIDAGDRVGGQYWRHREADDGAGHHHWQTLVRLRDSLPQLDFLARHTVWHVARTGSAPADGGGPTEGTGGGIAVPAGGGGSAERTGGGIAAPAGGGGSAEGAGGRTVASAGGGGSSKGTGGRTVASADGGRPAKETGGGFTTRTSRRGFGGDSGGGFTVHTNRGEVRARTLVVATGAYDRQLPFPGWTLPGVFTAGGAQALLKGHGVRAGSRVVVAGTGPFLLPVAAGLARAGAEVAGVFEAGSPAGFARSPLAVLGSPGKLAEGVGYLKTLARKRIPYRTRTAVVAAHGDDSVRSVTVASLDRGWRIVAGSEREIACDTVAVGYGFTPQLEIPLQLGCETRLGADGSLIAVADEQQRATVPGVYLAGEVCGVGGAELSLVEGELAGLHAAFTTVGAEPDSSVVTVLLRRRKSARAFAGAMHAAHPVRPGWLDWLDAPTLLCRCEEVTVGTVRDTIADLGATDARTVKLLARPGMGLCQGRVCGYATACLTAAGQGREPTAADLAGLAARPIAQPVRLGDLASG